MSNFKSGTGWPTDPYVISNAAHLANMNLYPNAHYVLDRDLEFPEAIECIGFKRPFTGVLDGQGFRIRNLKLITPEGEGILRVGLFARLGLAVQIPGSSVAASFGIVKNLFLETPNIVLETSADLSYLGALAGVCEGRVINCHVTGGNIQTASDNVTIGGMIGRLGQGAGVAYCSASISVAGGSSAGVGGLIGESTGAWVHSSYARGDVTGVNNVGGLVGRQTRFLVNCFYSGNVSGSGDNVGGLIGISHERTFIKDCFSSGDSRRRRKRGRTYRSLECSPFFGGTQQSTTYIVNECVYHQ